MLNFAEMSFDKAQESCAVLCVRAANPLRPTDLSLDAESYEVLQRLTLQRIDQMAAIELASPAVRDSYIQTLTRDMLERAAECGVCQRDGSPAWITSLGDLCMLMLADEAAVLEHGAERLIEMAHEDQVRAARDAGEPHDARALADVCSR